MPRDDGATPFQESMKWDYKLKSKHADRNLLQYAGQLLVKIICFLAFIFCRIYWL